MKKKIVMVFGVFDLLHPGHISFLKQAKKLAGPQRQQAGLRGGRGTLVVSVARDKNVRKVKGKLPIFDEKKRMEHIKQLKIAKKVVLGGLKDAWPHIKKEKPDIIALGYDQKPYVTKHETRNMNYEKEFKKELQKHGLRTIVVRLKPFRPEVFKSSKIRFKVKG